MQTKDAPDKFALSRFHKKAGENNENNKKASKLVTAGSILYALAVATNAGADEPTDHEGIEFKYSCWVIQGTDENAIKNFHGFLATSEFCHVIHNLVYHGLINTGSEIINHVTNTSRIDIKEDTDECAVVVSEVPVRQ